MARTTCLHTAQSNVSVFDAALAALALTGVSLHHKVRADLLAAAELQGGLTRQIAHRTAEALRSLSDGADIVLLTCSTLRPAAEIAADDASIPILRVDAALAAEAVKDGGSVVVLCAVETTVEPTRRVGARGHCPSTSETGRYKPVQNVGYKVGSRPSVSRFFVTKQWFMAVKWRRGGGTRTHRLYNYAPVDPSIIFWFTLYDRRFIVAILRTGYKNFQRILGWSMSPVTR